MIMLCNDEHGEQLNIPLQAIIIGVVVKQLVKQRCEIKNFKFNTDFYFEAMKKGKMTKLEIIFVSCIPIFHNFYDLIFVRRMTK